DYYETAIENLTSKLTIVSKDMLKKVQAARKSGVLDISKYGLTEIPQEVFEILTMQSPRTPAVQLKEFIANDNSIIKIDENVGNTFLDLEVLNIRHNVLRKLPASLCKLQHLTRLSLADNKLTNESLSMICSLASLIDVDLQKNRFDGEIPKSFLQLSDLVYLNLSNNEFSSVATDAFAGLTELRKLDLKSNKLKKFPFESIENSRLAELDLSSNKLHGSLISIKRIARFSDLRVLNAGHNQIEVVSDYAIILPALEVLNLTYNNLTSLGLLLLCTPSLDTLVLARNKMAAMPDGVYDLANLRHLDVSFNLLTELDPELGLIATLQELKWDGNRIVEKALMPLDIKMLKTRLRGRYNKLKLAEEGTTASSDQLNSSEELMELLAQKRNTREQIMKSQVLDLSNRGFSGASLPKDVVMQYGRGGRFTSSTSKTTTSTTDINLSRNELTTIPDAIMEFSCACEMNNLRVLDLSFNALGERAFVSAITLCSLEELSVANNTISSLYMLAANFQLPKLMKLDASFNKIEQIPPSLVRSFPALEELNMHENKLTDISADAFKGLEKIDLSNNSIGYLPPELSKIKTIVELKVQGNTFKTPRWQVVEKGTDALMEWLHLRLPENAD
ncbi:uncharacterized protein V1518DRAFT_366135, partial [Limtongia smithiae]|uniref:uncharacterized protein n=1 Tax=Limtongia smithiae TaxID=1125753 RepID=UPI0034CF2D8D